MAMFGNLSGARAVTMPTEGSFALSASGDNLFNIENVSGQNTTGLIYVFGNENSVNQTIAIYTYNLSTYYSPTTTRYIRIKEVTRAVNENGYGNVFLYLSTYSGSWTTTDQYATSTSSSISDIYGRNEVGQPCSMNYLIVRTGY